MDPVTRQKINELRNEADQEWAFIQRKEYLKDLMADLVLQWWHERDLHSDYVARGRMIEDMMTLEAMQNIVKQIAKHQREIYYRRRAMNGEQVGVTPEEIERAKAHPFEELHTFVHHRSACPIHNGDNPTSFELLKDNTARCHVCQWRGDTIDYWMWKNGRSFAESVRSLQ